ncbi:MAG: glycosyltransferase family 2 protein [Planctomycetes bacterium]|nr:glycosyltransferase family 2 protein [Planctomycetota bacterium]
MSQASSTGRTVPATVVIVNFNAGEHLRRCLECLADQTVLPERIVVVDNASIDGSLAACRRLVAERPTLADRTTIDETGANLGFAAASNRGIAAATGEFVALLNPDAFAAPGWLAAMVAAAARHPRTTAFGSRQMLAGREGVLDGIGDRWHVSGLAWRQGHGRPLGQADLEPREIFSPCAAAALYRRAALLEAGGFDDDYFCFGEDVDLGFRLRLAGGHARYVPEAVVEHVAGASSDGQVSTYLGHRNLVWTLVKNTPGWLLGPALLGHFLQSMVTGMILGCRGRGRAFARAKWDALAGLGRCWRKRRVVQSGRRISPWRILMAMDLGPCRRGR